MSADAMSRSAANIVEVFSSIQGEGPWVGTSTIFVRFGECDLRCAWCDSPGTWLPAETARLERTAGRGDFESVENPLSPAALAEACERLEPARHRFVSLTGGEPLLQPGAVLALAQALSGRGARTYLETHGLATEALATVLEVIDVVSMDWKLTSDVRRASDPRHGEVAAFHEAHARFLRTAHAGAEVYVKAVVTPRTTDAELDTMVGHIAEVDEAIPLVLQPVTPIGRVRERPSAERMIDLERRLSATLRDVRVIPQTHPVWSAR